MIYYQTLDLDKIDKEQLKRIIEKIKQNPCCVGVSVKDSSTKGYHVRIDCKIQSCNKCRFVFDDTNRFDIDFAKEEKFQNTTFSEKEFFRGNMNSIKHHCERCEKYAKIVTLTKKDLTYKEVVEKMCIGKITEFEPVLVHIGYVYLECPVCGWFKFVKNAEYNLNWYEK